MEKGVKAPRRRATSSLDWHTTFIDRFNLSTFLPAFLLVCFFLSFVCFFFFFFFFFYFFLFPSVSTREEDEEEEEDEKEE